MILSRRDPTEWVPREACGPGKPTCDLPIGQIVVWERSPYRVTESTPRPPADWKPEYVEGWECSGRPDPETWRHRPIVLTLAPEFADGHERHIEAPANHPWPVLPEHFAVCRLCQQIPPCRHEWEESVLRHARVALDAAMQILPGACHECREAIRPRQGTVRFEGANLMRPDLGDDSVVFHTRAQCWSGACRYDERWASAEPGRRRKMSCEGMAVWHRDGTFECTTGEDCVMEESRYQSGSVRHWVGQQGDCWCTAETAALAENAERP